MKSETSPAVEVQGKGAVRIPSLDGLRAVSIGLVMAYHIIGTVALRGAFANIGNLGVRVFFVISGFLITGLLLREQDRAGKINLLQFMRVERCEFSRRSTFFSL